MGGSCLALMFRDCSPRNVLLPRELVFWDVRDPARTIIVALDHERYRKLILEVADPEPVVTRLRISLRK